MKVYRVPINEDFEDFDPDDPPLDQLTFIVKRGEPVLVLRGQDVFAPVVLRVWLGMAVDAGMTAYKLREMEQTIAAMENWQPRKIPD